jgi:hypothetical protein
MTKQMIAIPIYWGDWWIPARGNSYSWIELNTMMQTIVGGRYMDGLNQYGYARGSVSGEYVFQEDPSAKGFGDSAMQAIFKRAIADGHVRAPDTFDLDSQQPFYSLIVKPGIEHLMDANVEHGTVQDQPDVGNAAYHFGFTHDYGDERPAWHGQACWVKSGITAEDTLASWVHEMAEAYSNNDEISDRCQDNHRVLVDGVPVPQYFSVQDNTCWPPADFMHDVQEAIHDDPPAIADPRFGRVDEGNFEGPHRHG